MVGWPPVVLQEEAAIRMGSLSLCLIAHRTGDSLALQHRGIKRGLSKRGRLEALEEDHLRSARLQTERTLDGEQASEIGLKGVEQGERFQRVHMAEVSTETDGMFACLPGDVVHDFFPALLVKIRITPVDAGSECIQHLQVRLGRYSRKIEGAVFVLETDVL